MAIQQADKLLKKHKDLHCAKVSSFALELLIFDWLYVIIFKGERRLISLMTDFSEYFFAIYFPDHLAPIYSM